MDAETSEVHVSVPRGLAPAPDDGFFAKANHVRQVTGVEAVEVNGLVPGGNDAVCDSPWSFCSVLATSCTNE